MTGTTSTEAAGAAKASGELSRLKAFVESLTGDINNAYALMAVDDSLAIEYQYTDRFDLLLRLLDYKIVEALSNEEDKVVEMVAKSNHVHNATFNGKPIMKRSATLRALLIKKKAERKEAADAKKAVLTADEAEELDGIEL